MYYVAGTKIYERVPKGPYPEVELHRSLEGSLYLTAGKGSLKELPSSRQLCEDYEIYAQLGAVAIQDAPEKVVPSPIVNLSPKV